MAQYCFFNRLAEIAEQYLKKGSKVYVEGSLRTRKWQDKTGNDRYTTEIVAAEMQMLDSRGGAMADDGGYRPRQSQPNPTTTPPAEPAAAAATAATEDSFDDDIPF